MWPKAFIYIDGFTYLLTYLNTAAVSDDRRLPTVKSYSWSENQISTEVEAKFDIYLLS